MTDLARILQAIQICYQDATTRVKKPSEWKANIENKIQRMSASIALLQKSAQAELSKEERKAGKKVMRDFGLMLIKPKDVTKAIGMLEESVQVKLQVHESRRENQFFELNRRSFYRQFTEGGKTPHDVSTDLIRDF